jgi:K+-sensing histidine kinase KdpD
MPTVFILAAAAMGLVLVMLAVVVIGIRQEPSSHELTGEAPRLMARMARRLVGVYVRRPDARAIPDKQREPSHRAHSPARRAD